jgi:hypothetical protein
MNREQRIWATVVVVLILLAVLGGFWALGRQTDTLKKDSHRSDCLLLAGQETIAKIIIDGERAIFVDNRSIHRLRVIPVPGASEALLKTIPSLNDICGKTAEQILTEESQKAGG